MDLFAEVNRRAPELASSHGVTPADRPLDLAADNILQEYLLSLQKKDPAFRLYESNAPFPRIEKINNHAYRITSSLLRALPPASIAALMEFQLACENNRFSEFMHEHFPDPQYMATGAAFGLGIVACAQDEEIPQLPNRRDFIHGTGAGVVGGILAQTLTEQRQGPLYDRYKERTRPLAKGNERTDFELALTHLVLWCKDNKAEVDRLYPELPPLLLAVNPSADLQKIAQPLKASALP